MTLLSDDPLDRWTQAQPAGQDVQRAMAIRSASPQALFRQNSLHAVDAALRARSRTQGSEEGRRQIDDGDWCYV